MYSRRVAMDLSPREATLRASSPACSASSCATSRSTPNVAQRAGQGHGPPGATHGTQQQLRGAEMTSDLHRGMLVHVGGVGASGSMPRHENRTRIHHARRSGEFRGDEVDHPFAQGVKQGVGSAHAKGKHGDQVGIDGLARGSRDIPADSGGYDEARRRHQPPSTSHDCRSSGAAVLQYRV